MKTIGIPENHMWSHIAERVKARILQQKLSLIEIIVFMRRNGALVHGN